MQAIGWEPCHLGHRVAVGLHLAGIEAPTLLEERIGLAEHPIGLEIDDLSGDEFAGGVARHDYSIEAPRRWGLLRVGKYEGSLAPDFEDDAGKRRGGGTPEFQADPLVGFGGCAGGHGQL